MLRGAEGNILPIFGNWKWHLSNSKVFSNFGVNKNKKQFF